jgi:hypothetical protein
VERGAGSVRDDVPRYEACMCSIRVSASREEEGEAILGHRHGLNEGAGDCMVSSGFSIGRGEPRADSVWLQHVAHSARICTCSARPTQRAQRKRCPGGGASGEQHKQASRTSTEALLESQVAAVA